MWNLLAGQAQCELITGQLAAARLPLSQATWNVSENQTHQQERREQKTLVPADGRITTRILGRNVWLGTWEATTDIAAGLALPVYGLLSAFPKAP